MALRALAFVLIVLRNEGPIFPSSDLIQIGKVWKILTFSVQS
jgi:hypothetical protein